MTVEEKYKQLKQQQTELVKSGHAVTVYAVYDSTDKLVYCDLTHYLSCTVCVKSRRASRANLSNV